MTETDAIVRINHYIKDSIFSYILVVLGFTFQVIYIYIYIYIYDLKYILPRKRHGQVGPSLSHSQSNGVCVCQDTDIWSMFGILASYCVSMASLRSVNPSVSLDIIPY